MEHPCYIHTLVVNDSAWMFHPTIDLQYLIAAGLIHKLK